MDTRAELLIDELSTHPVGQPIDFPYWRDRFQILFKEPIEESSRVILLGAYAALLNLIERGLVAQGRDVAAFTEARRLDWNHLCLQEALFRSGTELFHPADLNEIVAREVAAGRMSSSDFTKLAAAGASVFGEVPKANEPKKGFFRRLFG
jgi:hypothetical protein